MLRVSLLGEQVIVDDATGAVRSGSSRSVALVAFLVVHYHLRAEGSLSRMPYWSSLLADLLARHDRPEAARAVLDAAIADGMARDDVWWVPEVMRMRSAYDDEPAAVARLRSAARMASAHGSLALLRRCEISSERFTNAAGHTVTGHDDQAVPGTPAHPW
jgi:hypothetical protein